MGQQAEHPKYRIETRKGALNMGGTYDVIIIGGGPGGLAAPD